MPYWVNTNPTPPPPPEVTSTLAREGDSSPQATPSKKVEGLKRPRAGEVSPDVSGGRRTSSPPLSEQPGFAPFGNPAWSLSQSSAHEPAAAPSPTQMPLVATLVSAEEGPPLMGIPLLPPVSSSTVAAGKEGCNTTAQGGDGGRVVTLVYDNQRTALQSLDCMVHDTMAHVDGTARVTTSDAEETVATNAALPKGVKRLVGGVLTNLPPVPSSLVQQRPSDAAARLPDTYVQHNAAHVFRVWVPIDALVDAFEQQALIAQPEEGPSSCEGPFGQLGADFVSEVMRVLYHHVRVSCGCGGPSGALPPKDAVMIRSAAKAMLPQCVYDAFLRILPSSAPSAGLPGLGPPSYPVSAHSLHTIFAFDGFSHSKHGPFANTGGQRRSAKASSTGTTTAAPVATGEVGGMDDEGSQSVPIALGPQQEGVSTTESSTRFSSMTLVVPSGKAAVLGPGGGLGGVIGGTGVLFDVVRIVGAELERRSEQAQRVLAASDDEASGAGSFEEMFDLAWEARFGEGASSSLAEANPAHGNTNGYDAGDTHVSSASYLKSLNPPLGVDPWAPCAGAYVSVLVTCKRSCRCATPASSAGVRPSYPVYRVEDGTAQVAAGGSCPGGCLQFEITSTAPMYYPAP